MMVFSLTVPVHIPPLLQMITAGQQVFHVMNERAGSSAPRSYSRFQNGFSLRLMFFNKTGSLSTFINPLPSQALKPPLIKIQSSRNISINHE